MKKIFCIILFLPFLAKSQVAGDFRIKSDFVDTLVTGYENWILVETEFEIKNVTLTSDKATVKYDSVKKKYCVIVSAGNKYIDLFVVYKKSDGTKLQFGYSYRVVPLTTEMINRVYKK